MLTTYFQSLLKIATSFLVVSLRSRAFTQAFQEVSKVQVLLKTGMRGQCPYMLDSEAIMLYCFWIG